KSSPIPVTDSDSLMEGIDLFLASDDSMPPGIEDDDYDSEGDIRFLEELLNNDSLPILVMFVLVIVCRIDPKFSKDSRVRCFVPSPLEFPSLFLPLVWGNPIS
ncbi:hypothetical protein Tco_0521618, partial [Tanacetum coccineum]